MLITAEGVGKSITEIFPQVDQKKIREVLNSPGFNAFIDLEKLQQKYVGEKKINDILEVSRQRIIQEIFALSLSTTEYDGFVLAAVWAVYAQGYELDTSADTITS